MSLLLLLFAVLTLSLGGLGHSWQTVAARLANFHSNGDSTKTISLKPAGLTTVATTKLGAKAITIQAEAGTVMDGPTGVALVDKQNHTKLAPASLTKLMTAIIILDRHKPDEIVAITQPFVANQADAQALGLRVGQQFRLDDLMKMMLVYSANDAAEALAVYDAGSKEAFVARMNDYAKQLGLNDSHFENPTGLDTEGHISSVADLATMSRILLHNQSFRDKIKLPHATVQSLGGTSYSFNSTNQLLAYPYIVGLKTGKTGQAGECLITLSSKDGHELITVVLNSPNRFQESKNMVDWAFANLVWK